MIKHPYLFIFFVIIFGSCKKGKVVYNSFTEKELDFVSYVEGQELKIIDSIGAPHILGQSLYNREFKKLGRGWFDWTSKFQEQYEVGFNSVSNSPLISIRLYLYSEFHGYTPGQIAIAVNNYSAFSFPSKLTPPANNVVINSINYQNVYRLKAYKDGIEVNNTDTASIYWNKQYGFIQLSFPNGKAFTRTN
jgi:hypothetical protein